MSDNDATGSRTPMAPVERRNFAALLAQGIFRNVGIELASAKLVLPYLYSTLSGAVFFAGLMVPAVTIAQLLAQLFGARLITMSAVVRWYLAMATLLVAMALAILGLVAAEIAQAWLPVAFLATAIAVGAGLGAGTLAFQDILGRVLPERSRADLLFIGSGAVGVLTVAATIASQLLNGLTIAEEAWRAHVHLVWAATAMMLLSSLAALLIVEAPKVSGPTTRSTAPSPPYLTALREGMRRVSRLQWLRRFMVARFLLLSVEIAMPFFAVHAAEHYEDRALGLSFFVVSSSIGLTVGGLIWPRIGKKSIQRVLSVSAWLACAAAVLALVRNNMPDLPLPLPLAHAIMFALLGLATQGVVNSVALYVVDTAKTEERPYCIALSNLVAGVGGIGLALLAGFISSQRSVIWALMLMAVVNVAAAFYVRTLADPGDIARTQD